MATRTKYPRTAPAGTQFDEIAQIVADEIEVEAESLATRLFGEAAPGTQRMSQDELVSMVRRNAQHGSFLQKLAIAIGPEQFKTVADAAGLYTGYSSEEGETPEGPTFDDGGY